MASIAPTLLRFADCKYLPPAQLRPAQLPNAPCRRHCVRASIAPTFLRVSAIAHLVPAEPVLLDDVDEVEVHKVDVDEVKEVEVVSLQVSSFSRTSSKLTATNGASSAG